ncbi:SDR family oxidoreductase [Hymenobacter terrenus]|uniref:SDR family oxidoreductase n=1 Tax=Hymenobacter terrenus TaxID=1629124 RepID=UPI000619B327|nr:SDR family oxidoreductase [Hymenobacter terrenus]
MNNSLTGQVALVTGGTKGIGKAIVNKLLEAGAQVVVTARTVPQDSSGYHFIAADLVQATSAAAVASEILATYGRIDIIVNNAGANTSPSGGYSTLTDENWLHELQLNLLAAVRINKALLPTMLTQKSGVIINISTGAAVQPIWDITMAYSAAKAALNAYSKALASEVGPQGVRVNTVSPGAVKTPLMQEFIEQMAAAANSSVEEAFTTLMAKVGTVPLGRMAEPEEVADLVGFLVSAQAHYLTGSNFHVNGGALPVV